ncbi:early nodulin-like protein 1, partial [Tanacetum coccineum]
MAKPFVFLLLTSLFLFIKHGSAYEFTVGGSGDWSHASTPYYQWAEKTILQIGDSILFVYEAGKDSVLQVRLEDYVTCNTTSPVVNYSDGHSVVKLNEPGHYYFISGLVDNCKNNGRIAIVVMAYPSSNPLLSMPPPSPPTATSTELLLDEIMPNILM